LRQETRVSPPTAGRGRRDEEGVAVDEDRLAEVGLQRRLEPGPMRMERGSTKTSEKTLSTWRFASA
jgi:hypothetical protein